MFTEYLQNTKYKYLKNDLSKLFIDEYVIDKTYHAKKIISFTDTSIRFIDDKNKEIFISADKIKVETMK